MLLLADIVHRTAKLTTFSRFIFSRQQVVNLTDICTHSPGLARYARLPSTVNRQPD